VLEQLPLDRVPWAVVVACCAAGVRWGWTRLEAAWAFVVPRDDRRSGDANKGGGANGPLGWIAAAVCGRRHSPEGTHGVLGLGASLVVVVVVVVAVVVLVFVIVVFMVASGFHPHIDDCDHNVVASPRRTCVCAIPNNPAAAF
jgi:fatty acid desaturase